MYKRQVPDVNTRDVAPALFPTVTVLAAAPVPIFMFCSTASFQTLITPPDEFNSNAPAASISIVEPAVTATPPAEAVT